ncbi:HEPN domain-containing protein [bacterium]|nr:HEPN domain-containing protein [bacterium]
MNEMDEKEKERNEWFEYAERDLESARILLTRKGLEDVVATHIQQAVEKYLKGYLIHRGWELIKTHDNEYLMDKAAGYDKTFEKYYRFGRTISAFYFKHRYPPLPESHFKPDEIMQLFDTALEITELAKR